MVSNCPATHVTSLCKSKSPMAFSSFPSGLGVANADVFRGSTLACSGPSPSPSPSTTMLPLFSLSLPLLLSQHVWGAEPNQPTNTARTWTDSHTLAQKFVSKLTLEQKVNITTGVGWSIGRCVGNIAAQPEVGWPGLCLEDSPLGVRFADRVTAFPAGINAGAT